MTQIKSGLLLASKNAATGQILYTWRLTYPRIILSENLTHRVFSRNTSSTRAIPTMKMIRAVLSDMFIPNHIGSAQKGMSAGVELTGFKRVLAASVWESAGYAASFFAYLLYKLGVAKQIAGRLVEPFSWVTQIVTATDVANFLLLRNHKDTEPHFHELAEQMQEQVDLVRVVFEYMERESVESQGLCQILQPGQWHIPFIKPTEKYGVEIAKRISAARCARTSYTLLDTGRETSMQADINLCDKLFGGDIKHLSPAEHQAMAMEQDVYSANFRSFKQFRKELEA